MVPFRVLSTLEANMNSFLHCLQKKRGARDKTQIRVSIIQTEIINKGLVMVEEGNFSGGLENN